LDRYGRQGPYQLGADKTRQTRAVAIRPPEAGDNIAAIDKARGGPMRTLSIANGELWLHADGAAERDLRSIKP
jgi:hypothetical protein